MIGRLLDQRYQVVKLLAKGGFGHTYIARDTRRPGNPLCVVKHLKPATNDPNFLPTARRLFHREAEALEKLGHYDHIPRLLAYFEENEEFYLVQEFIDGHLLSSEMPPGAKWSENQVIEMLQEVLSILDFVHTHEVIHRDLKPQNLIRRSSDNKLVLVDFGAVKQVKMYSLMPSEQFKNETIPIGTPGYMPSEQAQGRPRPNSDIYALGMIGIQALTGLSPKQLTEDPVSGETLWRHHTQVSDQLAAILSKMIHPHYKYRYHSALEVLETLASINNPNTPTALAAIVSKMLRKYWQSGYMSVTKVISSLQERTKPHYILPEKTNIPDSTLPPVTSIPKTLQYIHKNLTIEHANTLLSSSRTGLNSIFKSHLRLTLFVATGSSIVMIVFHAIFSPRLPQTSPVTEENQVSTTIPSPIPERTQQITDQNKTEEKHNCVVVFASSNLHSSAGHRRTGKVIKAGTKVTVTGKVEGGWIEISAPESGWIWKSRTKNSC